jgi:glycerol-3-phosphate O-acyltransferase
MRLIRIVIFHLDYFFRHFSLPSPYLSGYIQEQLNTGSSALVSLLEDNGFNRRFVKSKADPIRYLVELQLTMEKPIVIVPLIMFFSKFPDRSTSSLLDMMFGTEINPGRIRRLVTLFKNPGKLFVEVSEPLNLQWFLNQSDHQGKPVDPLSLLLRKQLLFQINQHRVSTIGPVLKSPKNSRNPF